MAKRQAMDVPNLPRVKRILHQGMKGDDVKFIQERLDTLNSYFCYYPNRSLSNSGYFGDTTKHFLQHWQMFVELVADGWVDKATADSLEEYWAAVVSVTY